MNRLILIFSKKKWTMLGLFLITPLGFYTKFYSGPASQWVNDSMGGILYVMFWSLLFSVFIKTPNAFKIASMVFLLTCLLEILQLWHPAFLMSLRSNFIGRTILGTSFSWLDFVHYFIGYMFSVALLLFFEKRGN